MPSTNLAFEGGLRSGMVGGVGSYHRIGESEKPLTPARGFYQLFPGCGAKQPSCLIWDPIVTRGSQILGPPQALGSTDGGVGR